MFVYGTGDLKICDCGVKEYDFILSVKYFCLKTITSVILSGIPTYILVF